MNADATITLDRDGQIATITVNNQQPANVLIRQMIDAIGRTIDEFGRDDRLFQPAHLIDRRVEALGVGALSSASVGSGRGCRRPR